MVSKKFILFSLAVILFIGIFLQLRNILPSQALAATQITFSGLKVSGNKLVNQQGQTVVLHGVDRSGAEFDCVGGSVFDGPSDAASIQAMRAWDIDAVRVPMNEDCWLGINGVKTGGAAYQQAIEGFVKTLNQQGMYVILDLHWNAPGNTKATGQTNMADSDHSPAFWASVANAFKGNNTVIFDLYNEPHDISWSCWKSGCGSYAGMQQMVNSIRSTGATNVIMVGGLGWASDLSGWLANRPSDPQKNIAASVHMYGHNGCSGTSCINLGAYTQVLAQVPLIAGEFGESADGSICSTNVSNAFMNWMDQHQASYIAWTWNTWGSGCGELSLITNYNGTPHSPNGTNYKAHLLALGQTTVVGPSIPNKPTPTKVPPVVPKPTAVSVGNTSIVLTIYEHGIGASGDNTNPSNASLSNKNPAHKQIAANVEIFTTNNQLIGAGSGTVTYNANKGAYTGNLPIQKGFPTGEYILSLKTNGHLRKQVTGVQTITAGKNNTITSVTLIAGDTNNDNVINILDYNILMNCYSDLKPAISCTSDQKIGSDMNDDGSVNQIDYNLFIRELSSQSGAQ